MNTPIAFFENSRFQKILYFSAFTKERGNGSEQFLFSSKYREKRE